MTCTDVYLWEANGSAITPCNPAYICADQSITYLIHHTSVQVTVKGADVNFRCAAEGVVIDDNKWLGENRERPFPPSLS